VTLGGRTLQQVKRHPTIGDRVTIGAGAKVLGPLIVGDDSAIGANAVVTRDVPADSIATGIPAVIRVRTAKQREQGVDPTSYIDPAMYI
jgi:serine O-acetyltransferase